MITMTTMTTINRPRDRVRARPRCLPPSRARRTSKSAARAGRAASAASPRSSCPGTCRRGRAPCEVSRLYITIVTVAIVTVAIVALVIIVTIVAIAIVTIVTK